MRLKPKTFSLKHYDSNIPFSQRLGQGYGVSSLRSSAIAALIACLLTVPAHANGIEVEEVPDGPLVQVEQSLQTPATSVGQLYASPGASMIVLLIGVAIFLNGSKVPADLGSAE